jgi:hypothetical protein
MKTRAFDCFRQAQDDLLWTYDTLKAGRFAQACFAEYIITSLLEEFPVDKRERDSR